MTFSFVNPLPVDLNNAKFVIEGAGLGEPSKIRLSDPVGPKEEITTSANITATKLGRKTLAVKFYSSELGDVNGYLNFEVINA